MSKQCDMLEAALEEIIDNPSLFPNKQHMMEAFKESKAMLPPFREFVKYECEEKMQRCVRNGSAVPKTCLCQHIINELFNTTNDANFDTSLCMLDISTTAYREF